MVRIARIGVLAALLGLALARMRFRGRGSSELLVLLPMVTPEIIMGISLLVFFSQLFGLNGSIGQIAPVQLFLARVLPFGTVAVAAVVPVAVSLYLLTSTAWSAAIRSSTLKRRSTASTSSPLRSGVRS